jgi:hypothetical protein
MSIDRKVYQQLFICKSKGYIQRPIYDGELVEAGLEGGQMESEVMAAVVHNARECDITTYRSHSLV